VIINGPKFLNGLIFAFGFYRIKAALFLKVRDAFAILPMLIVPTSHEVESESGLKKEFPDEEGDHDYHSKGG